MYLSCEQFLRPTEFGEASSDDLSSEWESSAEVERSHSTVRTFPHPLSPDRPVAKQKGGLRYLQKRVSPIMRQPCYGSEYSLFVINVQLWNHSATFNDNMLYCCTAIGPAFSWEVLCCTSHCLQKGNILIPRKVVTLLETLCISNAHIVFTRLQSNILEEAAGTREPVYCNHNILYPVMHPLY